MEDARFRKELEFVLALANVHYLQWLSTKGYMDDDRFVAFLRYLLYWKQPQYVKYIIYPHALTMLDLLQHAKFREGLKDPKYVAFVREQQDFATTTMRAVVEPAVGGASSAGADSAAHATAATAADASMR